MALILGICIGLLFANWKTRKMDWSKITNDCQTWKRAGRIWLHGNGCPPKRRFEPRKNPLRARVSGNRCNNKLWYFAFYYWNSPNSTDFGNAWLVVMTMVEGIKKRKRKRNFAWWKENSNFPCLIPSLTCVSEVIQHWYKIRPRAILLLALNRRKRNRD